MWVRRGDARFASQGRSQGRVEVVHRLRSANHGYTHSSQGQRSALPPSRSRRSLTGGTSKSHASEGEGQKVQKLRASPSRTGAPPPCAPSREQAYSRPAVERPCLCSGTSLAAIAFRRQLYLIPVSMLTLNTSCIPPSTVTVRGKADEHPSHPHDGYNPVTSYSPGGRRIE